MYNHVSIAAIKKDRFFFTGYFPKDKTVSHYMAAIVPLPKIHKIYSLHLQNRLNL